MDQDEDLAVKAVPLYSAAKSPLLMIAWFCLGGQISCCLSVFTVRTFIFAAL